MKSRQVPIIASLVMLALLMILGFAGSEIQLAAPDHICPTNPPSNVECNVIQGVSSNHTLPNVVGATISGGGQFDMANSVTANFGTVGGGIDNLAGNLAVVGGGSYNRANGFRATISGGSSNSSRGAYSNINGGENNSASSYYTVIGGGSSNNASDRYATIGGGSGNTASFTLATVGGGGYNSATSLDATVAGGSRNTASGAFSFVGGGADNIASALDATISGGAGNNASGEHSTISGGLANHATGKYSVVGGGFENRAGSKNADQVQYATIGGGSHNTASGFFSTVPGGSANEAAAAYSFAAGHQAKVDPSHDGAFLLADSTASDFNSTTSNEFAVRATGGIRFVTAVDASGRPLAGLKLAPGSNKWESIGNNPTSLSFDQSQPIASLENENTALRSQIAKLDERIAALEQQSNANNLLPSGTLFAGIVLVSFIFSRRT
ncbi:MAG: hypothetical protein HZB51_31845 [Chloroflexi bacterium]|nr:hypothetical protein [Chloroflexota bacterium]